MIRQGPIDDMMIEFMTEMERTSDLHRRLCQRTEYQQEKIFPHDL